MWCATAVSYHSSLDLWMYLTCKPNACSVSKLWLHSLHWKAWAMFTTIVSGCARTALGRSGAQGRRGGTSTDGGSMALRGKLHSEKTRAAHCT
eukprot:CAMPEP_0204236276 /NCGR_PEP_ID=MMETSP0361-20130328/92339_1 /ASSEMBLY_ACC=CAM_ASM_000343 /TAXON_ID=268821 /ORGANISM="Scrippsiella Hangoei, Strain SHTV-5" /LENGTH=92 /DNA_ID=CAMNT_0051208157 /DNA_START=102 /DNA_END=380 /DNA_ORIENTATION=+